MYLKYAKPLHELLREWCGHRAVGLQERLGAAEAEAEDALEFGISNSKSDSYRGSSTTYTDSSDIHAGINLI